MFRCSLAEERPWVRVDPERGILIVEMLFRHGESCVVTLCLDVASNGTLKVAGSAVSQSLAKSMGRVARWLLCLSYISAFSMSLSSNCKTIPWPLRAWCDGGAFESHYFNSPRVAPRKPARKKFIA